MSFSEYLVEETLTEELDKVIVEFFGSGEESLSRKIASKNILKNNKNLEDFVSIFSLPLIKNILKILKKLPEDRKQKGAYLAYTILQSYGKDSKWFKMFKTTNQSLLTDKDESIKRGAHLAKRDIEGNRPELMNPSKSKNTKIPLDNQKKTTK